MTGRRTFSIGLAFAALLVSAAVVGPAASGQIPGQTPYPAQKVQELFTAAQTATPDGAINDYFAPGSTVLFRAYAVDGKTHKVLAGTDVKYFYVTIPNQPNVKLKYDPKAQGATALLPWTGTWTVPANYPGGLVAFKVFVKTTTKRHGEYVQFPVPASQLTITASPPAVLSPAPTAATAAPVSGTLDVSLYVDTVNGTGPKGAPPRPIGCTQTNVFKRGEQLVVRAWGADMATSDVLSSENVSSATASITGQPDLTLNWGAHGGTSKVYYWTAPWAIPTDYPLGQLNVHVVYKTDSGKTGTLDYPVVIIP
jgi:hypothetical protein